MSLDRDSPDVDECFVTALQIFEYCGSDRTGTLRVDALMDKFAPFVKTNKNEYSYLKSLLDPEHTNPEINVTMLSKALNNYSDSQKIKGDLDESFHNKSGQLMPQDSDSGISTDGFQVLEELQCELREKAHLAHQLRSQLDFTDRQHEEVVATLTAERDSLRAHLNMLREENVTLSHVRRDYEDACDRLCGSEQALGDARRELDSYRKRAKVLHEQVAVLETEKLTLQDLLTKSKDECHRINEMYASRQSALLEQNETLRTERADLAARLQDQDEFMQQMIKEKVLLEMELKDLLNKSNQTQLRLDRSIDVSYTEDQMLTALDSINADSRFSQENQLLDEESFLNALKEDQGRATNISLFDEIRLSFSNMSKHDLNVFDDDTQCEKCTEFLETSMITIATQTDEGFNEMYSDVHTCKCSKETESEKSNLDVSLVTVGVQTDEGIKIHKIITLSCEKCVNREKSMAIGTQTLKSNISTSSQTDTSEKQLYTNNNNVESCGDCVKCLECAKLNKYKSKLEYDLKKSRNTVTELQVDLDKYEDNLNALQKYLDEGNEKNHLLQTISSTLQAKIGYLEAACADQKLKIDNLTPDTCFAECQTDCDIASVSTQAELPCLECEKRIVVAPQRSLRRYLWDPLKSLFQIFAVVCFVCAVSVLCSVARRGRVRCERDAAVPWRWLDVHDLMDMLLRIEYVAEVPM